MLSFDEARGQLLGHVRHVGSEQVPLAAAAGRVMAGALRASSPLPGYDFSAMDGYAVAVEDFAGEGPWRFQLQGVGQAGHTAPSFQRNTTCRIFTGAPIPSGATAVVMQEQARAMGGEIAFEARPKPGAHIRRAGEDLASGALAIAEGTRLHPGHLALCAMLGQAQLGVAKKPIVTIVCTGDELRAPGEKLDGAAIYESNSAALGALAEQAGAHARVAPLVRDDPTETSQAISSALQNSDLLITVGGVSVGDHDLVRPALEQAGVKLDFWKVAIKPGKPLAVGRSEHAHVLGLPGNPASALVTFLLFGMPLLRAMQGDAQPIAPVLHARLAHNAAHSPGRLEFARANLHAGQGELEVTVHDNQSSGAATSLAWCNCLAVLPAGTEQFPQGSSLEVLRFSDF